ncbi:MAG TPA: hypothetical protein IAB10_02105 [Candidatus Avilachnospira avistercoris]|nr:hypothetical protein [Candidatus Avilachnospira avistercoris]
MRYMVMETHLAYAVVLGQDGSMLKAANRDYQVGEIVSDIIPMRYPETSEAVTDINEARTKRRRIFGWNRNLRLAAVSAAAVFAFVSWSAYDLSFATFGSVYMTVNPEVRIDVNKLDRVIDVSGINQDGERLISGYGYKRKGLAEVVEELGERAGDMGYIEENGEIALRLESKSESWIVEQEDELLHETAERLSQSLRISIEVNGTKSTVISPPETEAETIPETVPMEPETWVIEIPPETAEAPSESLAIPETAPAQTSEPTPMPIPQPTAAQAAPSQPQPSSAQTQAPAPQLRPSAGDSGYGDSSYGGYYHGVSDYGGGTGFEGSGQSDYGNSDYAESSYGGSDYDG